VQHGESEITTLCRVLDVSKKEIQTRNGNKKIILRGIIADDTAKLPFVSWEEREELGKDNVVLIENGYARRWKGLPTLYTGKNTRVRVIEEDIGYPAYTELIKPRKRAIGDIVSCGGAFDIIVEGDIVAISEGADTRVLVVERVLVVDDGTGAVFLELRKGEIEGLISFGLPVRARGNVVSSEKGYVLMADEVTTRDEKFILNEMKNFLCRYT
jgi:ssDNA-binding replication factor A large subunit